MNAFKQQRFKTILRFKAYWVYINCRFLEFMIYFDVRSRIVLITNHERYHLSIYITRIFTYVYHCFIIVMPHLVFISDGSPKPYNMNLNLSRSGFSTLYWYRLWVRQSSSISVFTTVFSTDKRIHDVCLYASRAIIENTYWAWNLFQCCACMRLQEKSFEFVGRVQRVLNCKTLLKTPECYIARVKPKIIAVSKFEYFLHA